MYKNTFYPLRSIVGGSIEIESILPKSPVWGDLQIEAKLRSNLQATEIDATYGEFLPSITQGGTTYQPAPGMAKMPLPYRHNEILNFITSQNITNNPDLSFNSYGLSALNIPPDLPFPETDPVASLFGYLHNNNLIIYNFNLTQNDNSAGNQIPFLSGQDKNFTFYIKLKRKALIGGICFNGYPYISSRIEDNGSEMTLGNFGLPREIRLTPLPPIEGEAKVPLPGPGIYQTQFIDSEYAYTRQEIISHSGLNYLCIDPVLTNYFSLTITDLPFISKKIDIDLQSNGTIKIGGFKGFVIPYLYFFEYKEKTKISPRVSAGILGIKSDARRLNSDGTIDVLAQVFPEYEFLYPNANGSNYYALFTAHSCLGQKRFFTLPYVPKVGHATEIPCIEEFISDELKNLQSVTMYLEQGEEYDRCIAGLKILFLMIPPDPLSGIVAESQLEHPTPPYGLLSDAERVMAERQLATKATLPFPVNFCEKIGIKIYEIDPTEGVSPTSVDLKSKYATLLADIEIDDFLDVIFSQFFKGIKFKKTSSSKYFAIELTNLGNPGQIVINSMHLVRSAHVSVQPRAAKTQQVKALHYRMIGSDLGDDFSKLGNDGFNFSIDRVVAGQTKNVLYSAMSLLDLLHTGGARIQSNVRRRAVEFEMTENYREIKGLPENYMIKKFEGDDFSRINFENRETDNKNFSWRSIESGKNVVWPWEKGLPGFEFESFSGSESRSRIEQVSSLTDGFFTELNQLIASMPPEFQGFMNTIFPPAALIRATTASNRIYRNPTNTGFWRPFEKFGFTSTNPPLSIEGTKTLNIPPFFLEFYSMVVNLMTKINSVQNSGLITTLVADGLTTEQFSLPLNSNDIDSMISKLTLVNGLSFGYNLGLSAGVMAGPLIAFGKAETSGGISFGVNSNLASSTHTSTNGSVGNIVHTGQELKYSLNRSKQEGYDNNISHSESNDAEQKRIVTRRELLNRDKERVRGAEVMWQDKIQDIITGSIPLNFTLPATATKMNFRTADDSLRVRFNSGFPSTTIHDDKVTRQRIIINNLEVDFWFEITEETIKDDY